MPNTDDGKIGSRIKAVRTALHLKQTEMSSDLRIGVTTLSGFENTGKVPLSMLALICRTYHVSEDYLLYGIGPMFIEKSRQQKKLDDLFEHLTPSMKRLTLRMLTIMNEPDIESGSEDEE